MNEIEKIASLWITKSCQLIQSGVSDGLCADDEMELTDILVADPESAWAIMLDIINRTYAHTGLKENEEQLLELLGAGVLEDLIQDNFSRMYDAIAEEAKTNEGLRFCLGCIWQGDLSNEDWAKLQELL